MSLYQNLFAAVLIKLIILRIKNILKIDASIYHGNVAYLIYFFILIYTLLIADMGLLKWQMFWSCHR